MFVEHSPHVHAEWYDAAFEDFGTGEAGAMLLDEWVFNKSCTLFESAAVNDTLASIMRTDGAIFFHHLLTLDSSGHVNKPYSPAYLANVARVDDGIRRVYEHAEAFFGPGNTAYLFTADHGMSNRGSHGDGQPVLTQTPIIAWGAGVSPPAHVSEEQLHWHIPPPVTDGFTGGGLSPLGPDVVVGWNDATPQNWGQLHELQRNDVAQADIAPLIAVLAGVPIPVNSVGRVPLPFLQVDAAQAAAVVLANARQIWHMVCTKMQSRRDRVFFFSEFPGPLSPACADACVTNDVCGEAALARAASALSRGNVAEAKKLAAQLIQGGLAACRWYETYDWPLLMCAVCLAYLGWAVFNLCAAGEEPVASGSESLPPSSSTKFQRTVNMVTSLAAFVISALLLLQRHPRSYHAYVMFPLFLWRSIVLSPTFASFRRVAKPRSDSGIYPKSSLLSNILNVTIFAVLIFVFIAGFYERSFYAGVALACGLWPLLGTRSRSSHFPSLLICRLFWFGSLLISGFFAFLPVEGGDWPVACQLGGILCCIVGAAAYILAAGPKNVSDVLLSLKKPLFLLQIVLCIVALVVLHSTNASLASMNGLPLLNQILSWVVSTTALLLPALSPTNAAQRTGSAVLGLTPGLVLLSVSYEPLFLAFLFAAMCIWPLMEKLETEAAKDATVDIAGQPPRPSSLSRKSRLAVTYLSMCTLSFFGAGNVASVASFEISSTWRFVTVFSPFLMGGLLMYKVLGPMVVVGVSYRFSVANAHCSTASLLRVNMAECSLVALFFFFNVKQVSTLQNSPALLSLASPFNGSASHSSALI
jgi:GPI ethanolamine phosphate transferase 1